MAINFSQLLGQLKMGVDILPLTDPDTVPHVQDPSHIPVYRLEVYDREIERWLAYSEGDVVALVTEAHLDPREMRLTEDGYPVMHVS